MATISLGKVALKWRGVYDSATAYNGQDIVSYEGTSYIAKVDAPVGQAPSNTQYWDVFAQGVEGLAQNAGDLLYFDGQQLQVLPAGGENQVLRIGAGGLPEWAQPTIRSGLKAVGLMKDGFSYRRMGAIMSDGGLRVWGDNGQYLHGTGNTTFARSYPVRTAFPATAGKITKWVSSANYSCAAIDEFGKLWTWGINSYGECGVGNASSVQVPYCASDNASNSIYGKTVIDIAVSHSYEGFNTHMVLCADGTVHTCGYNGYGQCGQGDTTQRNNFVQVPLLTNIVQIAQGRERYGSMFALKADGAMYSWGYNGNGELGQNSTTQMNIPMQIMYFAQNSISIAKMGSGGSSAWAIDTNDNLYTWGYNGYGNLGVNNTTQQNAPVFAYAGVVDCEMHSGSNDYCNTYIITTNNELWAAGDNTYGSLGVAADTTDRSSFTQCMKADGTPMNNVIKVVAGGTGSYNFAVALDMNGVCYGTGYNGNGQLGVGNMNGTVYWFNPVLIHIRKVVDVETVGYSSEGGTAFLMDDGQVYQTGYAGNAQLPEDDHESIAVPMPVIF